MRFTPLLLRLPALALLGALFVSDQQAATQEPAREGVNPPANNQDFEVLARGPVHEAFAQPGTQKPAPAAIVAKQPPPTIEEAPPDQKPEGVNVQWISGYWSWDDDTSNYIWVSGFWRDIPPGRQWVPGYWARLADGYQYVAGYWGVVGGGDNQYLPEPPESIDNGPSIEAPSADYSYVPGLWVYRETRYLWRPGYWLRNYPGYCWTPASYCWTPSGYLYCGGFWDYPLCNRGLLFAPVCFNRPFWNTAGWFWRPNYCVQPSVFIGGLFCRSNFNRYYFGDYYGAAYARRGFTPWVNNRIGGAVDANFAYYRWQNRDNPRWERDVNNVFTARGNGQLDRPGHNLAQQERIVRERGDRGEFGRDRDPLRPDNLNVLTPLAKLDKNVAKLDAVSESRLNEERKANQELRGLSRQREKVETQLAEKGPPAKNDTPRSAKLDLPKAPVRESTSAYPPGTAMKGEGKGNDRPGSPGKGPDNTPRFGPGGPSVKTPELKPGDAKPGTGVVIPSAKTPESKPGSGPAPIIGKQPDSKPGTGPAPIIGKQPESKPGTGPAPIIGKQPETRTPDFRPGPSGKSPKVDDIFPKTPSGPSAIRNPAPPTPPAVTQPPAIRNPSPLPSSPAVPQAPPAIRSQPAPSAPPAIRNPTPTPAPAIRSSPPPAVRPAAPPPAARPAAPPAARPAVRSMPAPARVAPAPKAPAPRSVAPARPAAPRPVARPPAAPAPKGKR